MLTYMQGLVLATPGISSDMLKVATQLLEKVEKTMFRPFMGGKFIEPGVLRAEGRYKEVVPDDGSICYATFTCFPYLDVHNLTERKDSEAVSSDEHRARNLLQACYPGQSTDERELEQAILKYGKVEGSKYTLYVPNLWAVVLGEGKCEFLVGKRVI